MEINYKDFVGFYRNVYPKGYCEHLIKTFNHLESNGAGSSRLQSENANRHVKEDVQIFLELPNFCSEQFNNSSINDIFYRGLQECFDDYVSNFSILKESTLSAHHMKMQKVYPGGGYHLWHFEASSPGVSERVLVYILYCNSMKQEEGSETEFLYQKMRVLPEENLLVIFPSSFTHTHRGNPVLSNNCKYIVTGWFHFT